MNERIINHGDTEMQRFSKKGFYRGLAGNSVPVTGSARRGARFDKRFLCASVSLWLIGFCR